MMSIDKMKQYYEEGLWGIGRVKNLAEKGIITADDYKTITRNELIMSEQHE